MLKETNDFLKYKEKGKTIEKRKKDVGSGG